MDPLRSRRDLVKVLTGEAGSRPGFFADGPTGPRGVPEKSLAAIGLVLPGISPSTSGIGVRVRSGRWTRGIPSIT
jgi:hypothetical protein